MNIKKEVHANILKMLETELLKCNNQLYDNKNKMKRLVEQQTVIKRERVKLTEMIYSIKTNEVKK